MAALFLLLALAAPLAAFASNCPDDAHFAVGSYTGQSWLPSAAGAGVSLFKFEDGKLALSSTLGPAKAGENPSYCAIGRWRALYCVNENGPGGLSRTSAFGSRIVPSGGDGSTHTAVMPAYRRWAPGAERVLVANYGGSVSALSRGWFGRYTTSTFVVPPALASAKEGQQAGPHPHMVLPLGRRHALVPDLGSDLIWLLSVGPNGELKEVDRTPVRKGDGPRHAARGPGGAVYVVNEISLSLVMLRLGKCGRKGFGICQRKNLLGPKVDTAGVSAAAIRVSADKRFLYVSVRFPEKTAGRIVGFRLSSTGRVLGKIGEWTSHGEHPRDFFIVDAGAGCKSYLAIVNRDSNNLVLVARDTKTGMLAAKPTAVTTVRTPTSVLQVPSY